MVNYRKALRLGEPARIMHMDFDLFGTSNVKSPEQLAERRALVRLLTARQMSQQPRNLWDGINDLARAIGGRITENRLDRAEEAGQAGAESAWKPFNDALMNKQAPDLGMVTSVLSNPWINPGRRSVAEDFYRQLLEANQPMTPYQKARLDLDEKELAQSQTAAKPDQSVAPLAKPDQGNASAPPAWDLTESNRPPPGTGSVFGKSQQIHTKYRLER